MNHFHSTRLGYCGESARIRVAYIGAHQGEEPPISGSNGSGTIFFSGCSLKCSYCQNYQISTHGVGTYLDIEELWNRVKEMITETRVHNINFVTPDHFFPYTFRLVQLLRDEGCSIPILYNLSGYQSLPMLRIAEEYADIYVPDFKYSDPILAKQLSLCTDYVATALDAITEMIRQKGFLSVTETSFPIALRGVLVRHLILPGRIENSIHALTSLFVEFGSRLPLSIMSQYQPVVKQYDSAMNRTVTKEEFQCVYSHAQDLGFEHLFVQFPEQRTDSTPCQPPFLPDFCQKKPFRDKGTCD